GRGAGARRRPGPSAVKRERRSADLRRMRLATLLILAAMCGAPAPAGGAERRLSVLAPRGTRPPPPLPRGRPPPYPPGGAMAREDRRAPVQALLFLGDNFYPKGLTALEVPERLRENVAGPYCYFLMLTRQGRHDVHDVCNLAPERTHPVPIVAVTGNHDVELGQGVGLQRERLPHYLGNWLMPAEARAYELCAGVSVIAFHPQPIMDGAPAPAPAPAPR